jgi:hypothetical protein
MDFITVSEAVHITGKSISTIRRLAKRLESQGLHDQVRREPGPQGERYLIRRDIVLQELGQKDQEEHQPEHHEPRNEAQEQLVNHLKEQVHEQQNIISQLLERQRETNILLHSYQQRLLPDYTPEPKPTVTLAPRPSRRWIWILLIVATFILLFLVLLLSGQLRFPLFTS